jgi:hypothetical protein
MDVLVVPRREPRHLVELAVEHTEPLHQDRELVELEEVEVVHREEVEVVHLEEVEEEEVEHQEELQMINGDVPWTYHLELPKTLIDGVR